MSADNAKLIAELLPCPHCGSPAARWKTMGLHYVGCTICTSAVRCERVGDEQDDAVQRWNRRAALSAQSEPVALRKALLWYRDEAAACARAMLDKPPKSEAMLACVTVLSLDAGKRADAALAEPGATEGEG